MKNVIKEQVMFYDRTVSEIDLISIILGEKAAKCLLGNNIKTLKDIDIMTNEELLRFNNIGPETLCKIRSLINIVKMNPFKADIDDVKKITSPENVASLCNDMVLMDQEVLRVLFLNTKNAVTGQVDVFKGSLNSAVVHPREIFKEAIKRSSANIIVIHNHPSGDPTPSKEDINITIRLKECSKIIGIELLDHVIIGEDKYVSLKQKGII